MKSSKTPKYPTIAPFLDTLEAGTNIIQVAYIRQIEGAKTSLLDRGKKRYFCITSKDFDGAPLPYLLQVGYFSQLIGYAEMSAEMGYREWFYVPEVGEDMPGMETEVPLYLIAAPPNIILPERWKKIHENSKACHWKFHEARKWHKTPAPEEFDIRPLKTDKQLTGIKKAAYEKAILGHAANQFAPFWAMIRRELHPGDLTRVRDYIEEYYGTDVRPPMPI